MEMISHTGKKSQTVTKLRLIAMLLLSTLGVFAQQQNAFNAFNYDLMQLNIAGVGQNYFSANLNYRAQWLGVKDGFRQYQLNSALHLGNQAVRFKAYSNSAGLLKFNTLTGAYVYKLKLNDDNHLFMGLGASYMQFALAADKAIVPDVNDVILQGGNGRLNSNNFDCESGLMWYGKNLTLGLAVNHLYNTSGQSSGLTFNFKQSFVLNGSYDIKLTKDFDLRPALVCKYLLNTNLPDFTLLTTVRYKKMFDLGVGYRYPNATYVLIGVDVKGMTFVYSFDYNFSQISTRFGTSHQVLVGFRIKDKNKNTGSKQE